MNAREFIEKKNAEFEKKKTLEFKDIGRKGTSGFYREAWTFMTQSNNKEKVFVIERMRKEYTTGELAHHPWKQGDIEYRIGYYILGKIGKAKGNWWWGQACPLIPAVDLPLLLNKAREEGTIL
ncbi:MAG: hypothetical protein NTZ34_04135 [Chloroflexi bacterium]|nr:hypothetical protein [Chloroflexota bacterium]